MERNWTVVEISRRPYQELEENEVMLKGIVQSDSQQGLTITYDIESYFVPEGQGKDIEKAVRRTKVKVLLAIDQQGQAAIDSLYMNGKKVVFK